MVPTRRRQDSVEEEGQIVRQHTTTGSGRDSTFRFDCEPKVTAHRKCRRTLQEGLAIGDGALPDFVASRVPRKWRDVAASHEGETDHPSGTSPHGARMRGGLLIDFPFAGHRTDCLVTLETSNLSLWRQLSRGGWIGRARDSQNDPMERFRSKGDQPSLSGSIWVGLDGGTKVGVAGGVCNVLAALCSTARKTARAARINKGRLPSTTEFS